MSDKIEITPETSALTVELFEDGVVLVTRNNWPDPDVSLMMTKEEADKLIHAIELLRKNQKEVGNVN